jgi:hypothetical protein
MNKRVFFAANDNLQDLSVNLNKYDSIESEFTYISNQDYLYIGSRLPFNSIYFKLKQLNENPANMYVEVWDGENWEFVDELIDETNGFKKSGYITFTPNRDAGWSMESTNSTGGSIPGLQNVIIYDKYWMRVTFDADLTDSVSLSWIGHIFADDADLESEYPDLGKASVKVSYKTGKTNWEEQLVRASEIVIEDLMINRNIIDSSQILDRYDYKSATIQKAAEIIFNAFGDDFVDQKQRAREEYQRRLSIPTKKIDLNANAVEDVFESRNTQGWLSR